MSRSPCALMSHARRYASSVPRPDVLLGRGQPILQHLAGHAVDCRCRHRTCVHTSSATFLRATNTGASQHSSDGPGTHAHGCGARPRTPPTQRRRAPYRLNRCPCQAGCPHRYRPDAPTRAASSGAHRNRWRSARSSHRHRGCWQRGRHRRGTHDRSVLAAVGGSGNSVEAIGNPLDASFAFDEVGKQAVGAGFVEERWLFIRPQLDVSAFCTPIAG